MNKKPGRTGPRIRITKPGLQTKAFQNANILSLEKGIDERNFIYTCQYCRLKFTQNSHFFRHMMSNHELQQQQATFQCNNCHIVFAKKSNLDLHCQTHHQAKSKSKCEACSITFKSRYCLRRHLKLKQILKENTCLKCRKNFTSKEHLAKHMNNKHAFKNLMFQCNYCSLKFRAKESLSSHLSRIHKML